MNYTDVLGDIESLDPSEQLQALKKDYQRLAEDHKRVLGEWYKDCEGLHKKIVDLQNNLTEAGEVLKYIEEQSRKNTVVVVGAPQREAIIQCLNSICEKVDLSKD